MKRFIQTDEQWQKLVAEGANMTIRDEVQDIIDGHIIECGVTKFEEMDSLAVLTMIMDVEDALDFSIPIDIVDKCTCEQDFIDQVVLLSEKE